ncbi:hypothetical protein [Neolewinella litorea]|uniref:Uncharacterized protein n=1 Tax=Neolewinella litorea TaxID=2562452 RepID=A0A4S4NLC0_9BACT|nr:hypothetical protein [Neolewinella litorea]THH40689.1 hypothetical protein E4021_08140 [Neolewinella litorea]
MIKIPYSRVGLQRSQGLLNGKIDYRSFQEVSDHYNPSVIVRPSPSTDVVSPPPSAEPYYAQPVVMVLPPGMQRVWSLDELDEEGMPRTDGLSLLTEQGPGASAVRFVALDHFGGPPEHFSPEESVLVAHYCGAEQNGGAPLPEDPDAHLLLGSKIGGVCSTAFRPTRSSGTYMAVRWDWRKHYDVGTKAFYQLWRLFSSVEPLVMLATVCNDSSMVWVPLQGEKHWRAAHKALTVPGEEPVLAFNDVHYVDGPDIRLTTTRTYIDGEHYPG